VVVRAAWQCDDAFITFRTADNLCRGFGPVWNPPERVQSFTSPLWMLIAAGARLFTGEVYFSTLALSIALTAVTAWLLGRRLSRSPIAGALGLLALSTSVAVTDFATSGLEGPLLTLLLLLLLLVARAPESSGRARCATLLGSGLLLTRLDAALFWWPAFLVIGVEERRRPGSWRSLLLGLMPIVLWEAFALVYYGSPWPNTAYAKLNLRIPVSQLLRQGGLYLLDAARFDPITLLLVVLGPTAALYSRRPAERALGGGIALYLLYVLRIGGDFMSGRLLAAPAVLGVGLGLSVLSDRATAHPVRNAEGSVAPPRAASGKATWWGSALAARRWPQMAAAARSRPGLMAVTLALCAYGALWPRSNWRQGESFGADWPPDRAVRPTGIADERAYYFPSTGLLPVLERWSEIRRQGLPVPPYDGAVLGRDFGRGGEHAIVMAEVGFYGYFAGPEKRIIDTFALCDPLLARLPYRPQPGWRIGHFDRPIPAGYPETVAQGRDCFRDPGIAALYASIERVVTGPLFTRERWREIRRWNSGPFPGVSAGADSPPSPR